MAFVLARLSRPMMKVLRRGSNRHLQSARPEGGQLRRKPREHQRLDDADRARGLVNRCADHWLNMKKALETERFCLPEGDSSEARRAAVLPLMRSRAGPRFALACEMLGEIVVASKFSALKENAVAFHKDPVTARPLNRGIPPANPAAVGLLFEAF